MTRLFPDALSRTACAYWPYLTEGEQRRTRAYMVMDLAQAMRAFAYETMDLYMKALKATSFGRPDGLE